MVIASFSAWQALSIHVEKMPSFDSYLKKLGLSETNKDFDKRDLELEGMRALENVERIKRNLGCQ